MDLQLRKYRRLAGLNQQQMADALNVKKRTYGSWERGEANMSFPQACACADILDCTLDELAGRTITRTYTDAGQEIVNICYESMNDKGKETLVSVAQSMERDVANRIAKNGAEPVEGGTVEDVA